MSKKKQMEAELEEQLIIDGLKTIREAILANDMVKVAQGYEIITGEKLDLTPKKTKLQRIREAVVEEVKEPTESVKTVAEVLIDDTPQASEEGEIIEQDPEFVVKKTGKMKIIVSPPDENELTKNEEIASKRTRRTRPLVQKGPKDNSNDASREIGYHENLPDWIKNRS